MKQLYDTLDETIILNIAEEVGLNPVVVKKQFLNPRWLKQIQKDIVDGKKAGVKGVPKVFLNGRVLNQRDLFGIQTAINKELLKLKK